MYYLWLQRSYYVFMFRQSKRNGEATARRSVLKVCMEFKQSACVYEYICRQSDMADKFKIKYYNTCLTALCPGLPR